MASFISIVEPHPSWNVIDSSKLTTYMSCPRKYFYEYVLGWRSDYPNNHLTFGTAWHLSVEFLLQSGVDSNQAPPNVLAKERLEYAQFLFLERYRRDFPPSSDELYEPKTPRNAFASLEDYAKHFESDKRLYEVLHTEVGGLVLIGPEMPMHFRMDAILRKRENGAIINLDHKTSQRKLQGWADHYQLDTKTLLYLHALYCLYGSSNEYVQGARVRLSVFYKAQPTSFEEASIEKTKEGMQDWLTSTQFWYERLQDDLELLVKNEDSDDSVMAAFPKNPNACFDYGKRCLYFDYCNSWSNPLQRCESVPLGMKKEFWDPREDEVIKERVDLTNLPIIQGA